jgi:UDP:flavonoid glycosyltransferase YjiC (YdhE family)
VLRETGEFASMLLAEHLGTPHLHVSIFLAAAGEIDQRGFAAAIDRLREEAGPGMDPLPGHVLEAPYLTLAPRVLEDPGSMPPAGTRRYRAPGPAPHAAPDPDQAPRVYVSFGSVAAGVGYYPGLYRAAIDELAGLDARVLVTVGNEVDPADLGPLPPGVRAERWVPQAEVMTQAAVMVGHGGSGSTLAAMAAGVPLALIPLFADQLPNARRVADLGAGLALDGPDGLRDAVETLVHDPALRRGARAVAAEIATLPPIDDVVELLAGMVRDGRPREVSRAAAAR